MSDSRITDNRDFFDSAFVPWAIVALMVTSGIAGAFWILHP
jgi:hypothetical protein